MRTGTTRLILITGFTLLTAVLPAAAQPRTQPPQVTSPEVSRADRSITFRLHAPNAQEVRVTGGDIPDLGRGALMEKNDQGVWETTLEPLLPGSYRYLFNVDGLSTVDPRNPAISESNANVWSLVHLPGADYMDTREVPHGAIAEVTYHSSTLDRPRRMHVYTPPGYEAGSQKYPVFYLLHGASDSDDSWSSIGRAGFILDNLIASGKAKPMLVVMPAGHTGPFSFGRGSFQEAMDEFVREFTADILPHVEKSYRVHTGREHRAIAGLSMGGAQTLSIAIPRLEKFGYVGVYSSGIFGIAGGFGGAAPDDSWEKENKKYLDNAEAKDGLKLLWFGTGKDDFLLQTTRATVEMFKQHQFDVEYDETEGGHTWMVWREYLRDFAPRLFP